MIMKLMFYKDKNILPLEFLYFMFKKHTKNNIYYFYIIEKYQHHT